MHIFTFFHFLMILTSSGALHLFNIYYLANNLMNSFGYRDQVRDTMAL